MQITIPSDGEKMKENSMTLYEELQKRGLIAQVTDEKLIPDLINNGKAKFYIGFDPTADSLHVGHFMALILMKRLQMGGNKPIALVGGGTGMIGDPSGRTDMRSMMTTETIDHNCECFKKQMSRFIEFGDGDDQAMMVNNADWLRDLNFLEFMRDIGSQFNVATMLRARAYENRMAREGGLTFFEMGYMLLQAYDFLQLYERYGCNMEFGGDDQWSNMLAGANLIRKKLGKDDAGAMTINLLLKHDGTKMGKTAGGAVWLDPDKTSPYDFYQYWRNVDDQDVLKFLRMMTFLPLEQIEEMESWEGSQLNEAKRILASELTAMVHGEDEAKKAEAAAKSVFTSGVAENMPETHLTDDDFTDGQIDIRKILQKAGYASSLTDGKRAVEQGGVSVNGEAVKDPFQKYQKEDFDKEFVLRKGKKKFCKVLAD
jgi:tyrosyl-tRNA synthetase